MIIITIADIHGQCDIPVGFSEVVKNADLLLIAGDITNFGNGEGAIGIIRQFEKYVNSIFAVHGNCDRGSVSRRLKDEGYSIDNTVKKEKGILFAGLGGGLSGQLKDFEFEKLEEANCDSLGALIFLTHVPPYMTKIDRVSGSHHIGSEVVNGLIEKYEPLACFSGHAHESPGIDRIGNTLIANPGPFSRGGYIYSDIDAAGSRANCFELRYF